VKTPFLRGALTACALVLAAGYTATAANSGKFDGPAELPRVFVKSALSDSPAPGKSILVKDVAGLRSALDQAGCGDTIRLQAGVAFVGILRFPAKPCDDNHWIIVRTSAPDSALPAEGTRLTPCYGGVEALPGRPRYACSSPENVLAKITFENKGSGPIFFEGGANHYRLIGLEITRGSPGTTIYNLVNFPNDKPADHVIFDRVWMHGTAQDETVRGIILGGSKYVAVVDSYFTDFHCVAMGSCTDAQAILGGLGDLEMGPYKIINNFMEGAAETILFGGGGGTSTPTDIEVRRNYMYKPTTWRQGDPNFVGGTSGKPFIVKNLFELKNAQRVLLEGNVLENSWGGFSQAGFAVLLMAKNQMGRCAACRVTDVTFRYNRIAHVASGFQIATALEGTIKAVSSGTERISIHDVIIDDIGGLKYGGLGILAQVTSSQPLLKDVSIDHVTAFPPRALFIMGAVREQGQINSFTFTNNLVSTGVVEIVPVGGGARDCAFQPEKQTPTGVLSACFTKYTFSNNVIVGSRGGWPRGNFYPSDQAAAGVVGFSEGRYRLCREKGGECKKPSPAAKGGADGKDVGADVEAVFSATKGVE
jgi:hypothetical protein